MRTLIFALLMVSTAPALAFSTVDEYAADFAKARECRSIEGRKVWAGKDAYYIQARLFSSGQSGALDDEVASAVPIADNDKDALAPFEAACK